MPDLVPDVNRQRFGEVAKCLPALWNDESPSVKEGVLLWREQVAFVVANIVGLYAIYSIFHLAPLLQDFERYDRGLTEAIVFNLSTLLLLVSYLQCILVHPGTIPDKEVDPTWEYIPQETRNGTMENILGLQETKKSGDRRHCKWCAKYKPDRCHHCRVCRVCILKMDHHCPWIYNCVGFRNHKYFFLLLLYSAIDCHLITWTMLESVRNSMDTSTTFASMFLLLFGETLAAFLGILVTAFLGFHIWLMLKAMTTIEFCEKSMKQTGYDGSVYNRGLSGNIRAVLGDYVILWLLPCSPPAGNGLYFYSEDSRLSMDLEVGRGMVRKMHKKAAYGSTCSRTINQMRKASCAGTGSAPTVEDRDDGDSTEQTSEQDLGKRWRQHALLKVRG